MGSSSGITMDIGKFISFSFNVTQTSLQSISSTSQIQFFLKLTFSKSSVPVHLKICTFPAILFKSMGT